ncbi:amidase [Paenibacillus pinistramenti]|uniref:amidase n=1 Tax=Paenibacillus pinistramenti TaxID=1768003 RepID=UPI001109F362|nr:amidase [Paenibacillus pinistramenti]
MKEDRWNAYINEEAGLEPVRPGMLDGLTFAVKDVFALKGRRSAAGNPDWLRTHEPAQSTAPVIHSLLSAGARMKGITHTDELMYSLSGENHHYGTPVNPKAPGRIPGGSSSGSAAAVAAGLNDFAVGTDTGGSVRVPSSYCGIYGFRPTHGTLSAEGVIPLAASFDTAGWMAREPGVLRQVGSAIGAPQDNLEQPFRRLLLASDAWELLDDPDREALLGLIPAVEQSAGAGSWIRLAGGGGGFAREGSGLADGVGGLAGWAQIFRTVQGFEIWEEHGAWITAHKPAFGPGIAERFAWTATLSAGQAKEAREAREWIKAGVEQLLGRDGILLIPTVPGGAPLKGSTGAEAEAVRAKVMQLSCIAGLAGCPQVTIPAAAGPQGLPLGLSVIAGPHQDGRLLKWLEKQLAPLLPLPDEDTQTGKG